MECGPVKSLERIQEESDLRFEMLAAATALVSLMLDKRTREISSPVEEDRLREAAIAYADKLREPDKCWQCGQALAK